MSLERARKAINLQKTDKVPQWEYIWNPGFLKNLTGIDPMESSRKALIRASEILDIDFMLPISEEEEKVIFAEPGKNVSMDILGDPEEIFRFDPFNPPNGVYRNECGINPGLSLNERAEYFQNIWKGSQDAVGNTAMIPICTWLTLLHAFTVSFGYEATCVSALTEPERFKEVVEKFAEVSLKQLEAFAQTDAALVLCHDDLGMVDRTIYSPDWYRENIFPWYRELWKPLKKAGKKILFYSDGNIDNIMDDLVETGVDGLFIDSCSSLERAVEKFGGRIFLIGNADVMKMTYGSISDVKQELGRCLKLGKGLPGYILCTSGQFLNDVPEEVIRTYFELSKRMR